MIIGKFSNWLKSLSSSLTGSSSEQFATWQVTLCNITKCTLYYVYVCYVSICTSIYTICHTWLVLHVCVLYVHMYFNLFDLYVILKRLSKSSFNLCTSIYVLQFHPGTFLIFFAILCMYYIFVVNMLWKPPTWPRDMGDPR